MRSTHNIIKIPRCLITSTNQKQFSPHSVFETLIPTNFNNFNCTIASRRAPVKPSGKHHSSNHSHKTSNLLNYTDQHTIQLDTACYHHSPNLIYYYNYTIKLSCNPTISSLLIVNGTFGQPFSPTGPPLPSIVNLFFEEFQLLIPRPSTVSTSFYPRLINFSGRSNDF